MIIYNGPTPHGDAKGNGNTNDSTLPLWSMDRPNSWSWSRLPHHKRLALDSSSTGAILLADDDSLVSSRWHCIASSK